MAVGGVGGEAFSRARGGRAEPSSRGGAKRRGECGGNFSVQPQPRPPAAAAATASAGGEKTGRMLAATAAAAAPPTEAATPFTAVAAFGPGLLLAGFGGGEFRCGWFAHFSGPRGRGLVGGPRAAALDAAAVLREVWGCVERGAWAGRGYVCLDGVSSCHIQAALRAHLFRPMDTGHAELDRDA